MLCNLSYRQRHLVRCGQKFVLFENMLLIYCTCRVEYVSCRRRDVHYSVFSISLLDYDKEPSRKPKTLRRNEGKSSGVSRDCPQNDKLSPVGDACNQDISPTDVAPIQATDTSDSEMQELIVEGARNKSVPTTIDLSTATPINFG